MNDKWYSSGRIRQILQISPQCLYQMRRTGRIEYRRVSERKYLFKLPERFVCERRKGTAIYARVSTSKQAKDLRNQLDCLRQYVVSNGDAVDERLVFQDVASGMNESRKGLNALVGEVLDGNVGKVVVSNRDRLTRFGFGYLKSLFERFDCEIVEVNLTDSKTFEQELSDDLISIVHHFSMRFYGRRRNRMRKIEGDLRTDSCK